MITKLSFLIQTTRTNFGSLPNDDTGLQSVLSLLCDSARQRPSRSGRCSDVPVDYDHKMRLDSDLQKQRVQVRLNESVGEQLRTQLNSTFHHTVEIDFISTQPECTQGAVSLHPQSNTSTNQLNHQPL